MKEIPVYKKNQIVAFAIVDDTDFEKLSSYKWTLQSRGYVKTWDGDKAVYMHRLILDCVHGEEIDHINKNKLDNRRGNLRLCTRSQNNANRNIISERDNGSVYKGVRWDEDRKKFLARIGVNGKTINLGRYKNEIDAARAYDLAALKYYGEYASLNFSNNGGNNVSR